MTWCYMYIVILPTLVNKNHEEEWVAFYFNSISAETSKQPKTSMNNGPLHTKFQVKFRVVAKDAEAKIGDLYNNGQNKILLRTTLKKLSINNLQHK